MTAALATLLFLVAGWMAVSVLAIVGRGQWAKMSSALVGRSPLAAMAETPPVRMRVSARYPATRPQPVRAKVEWRAAA